MLKTSDLLNVETGNREFVRPVEQACTLSTHNVVYEVHVKKSWCGRSSKKQILKGITGIFKPGMNAILGPTGSGKSSLLDILAGRKDPQNVSGTVLVDGAPPPDNFKCMVGYVVQDDVVMGTLTVRENISFSAALRLPSSVSKHQRALRINEVIQELGLKECADRKVGTEFIRGISGGERKRTNIGMELIISPPVLFLDEPTTGLDASTANAVINLLKKMSDRGQTIVFSIHQPRYAIYKLFDNMTLLSAGEVVFNGPAEKALEYFNSIGYVCEQYNNPADFFLDVISGDARTQDETPCDPSKTDKVGMEESLHTKLVNCYKSTEFHETLVSEAKSIHDQYKQHVENRTLVRKPPILYATSFLTQLKILSGRATKNLVRHPQASISQFIATTLFSLVVGTVFFQINTSLESGIQNRRGALFFIIMNQVFSNMSALELFIKERVIFIHEHVSGFYRISAYFLTKVLCDVLPMRFIPVVVFTTIIYWMVGFQAIAYKYLFFLMNLFLTTLSAAGLAFSISASVSVFAIAQTLISMVFIYMMLFGGLLRNLDDIASWLGWLKYLSIFRYSLDAVTINELKDQVYCTDNNCTTGNKFMDDQGIDYATTWDLWQKEVALVGFIIISFTIAYIRLRSIKMLH